VIAVVPGCVSMVASAEARLNTQHIKDTVGLKSGSQGHPGVYVIAPLFCVDKTDEVKDRDEARLPFAADPPRWRTLIFSARSLSSFPIREASRFKPIKIR
jgi:hypothetical protein